MSYRSLVLITVALALCFTGISRADDTNAAPPKFEGSSYLFVWAGDAARQSTDFLAVIDANPSSPSYGRIVRTVRVDATGIMPHHTEYEFPQGNMLIANGWVAGRTFIFGLSQPLKPRLAGQFQDRAGYSFPHSFFASRMVTSWQRFNLMARDMLRAVDWSSWMRTARWCGRHRPSTRQSTKT